VSFSDALHGCAVATRPGLQHEGWRPSLGAGQPGTLEDLSGVVLADSSHGWAVGGDTTHDMLQEVILATATGGFGHAPTTRLATKSLWQNGGTTHIATWTLAATPDPTVGAIERTSMRSTGRGQWAPDHLPAPLDHSGDGSFYASFRSVGTDGSVEAYKWATLGVDTVKPSTKAPYAAAGRRGRAVTLKYKVSTRLPAARRRRDHQGEEPRRQGREDHEADRQDGQHGHAAHLEVHGAEDLAYWHLPVLRLRHRLGRNKQANVASNKLIVK